MEGCKQTRTKPPTFGKWDAPIRKEKICEVCPDPASRFPKDRQWLQIPKMAAKERKLLCSIPNQKLSYPVPSFNQLANSKCTAHNF
jgi:hypothetical protein